MSRVLNRLLEEDLSSWDKLVDEYEMRDKLLRVPIENTTETLHEYNRQVTDFYSEVCYDYGRARRNKDAIQRLLKSVMEDYYKGNNSDMRKAGGIQFARQYPAPEFWPEATVNLYDFEDQFTKYFNAMEATLFSLRAKMESKITNNSLLRIESQFLSG